MDPKEVPSTLLLKKRRLNGGSNEVSDGLSLTVDILKKYITLKINELALCVNNQGVLKGIVKM